MSRKHVLALLGLALGGVACTREPQVAWRPVRESDLSETQKGQVAAATRARDALFQKLLGELTTALASSGPAGAIAVCRDRAPKIASAVAADYGLRIGRTSQRLRNPQNTPPAWAAEHVAGPASEPAYLALPEDALGVLLPIKTAPQCLVCHGESIAEEVAEALAASYPQDRATGFQAGELRGWFWIEVPGGPAQQ